MHKSSLGHLQVNVDAKNINFYKDFFNFLEWSSLYQDDSVVGVADQNGAGLWFVPAMKQVANDYDGNGTNHIAISVPSQADVDETVAYLKKNNVACLFETPRHRPDFAESPEHTYYQVMFESPDRILFEVVYTGPLG